MVSLGASTLNTLAVVEATVNWETPSVFDSRLHST